MSVLASIHKIDDSLARIDMKKLIELRERVVEDKAFMDVVHIEAKVLIDRKVETRSKTRAIEVLG